MKEIIEGIDCSWYKDCVYYKQCERLKQENERLKSNFWKIVLSPNPHYMKALNKFKSKIREIAEKNEKYKQTLEKIRNITEKLITELPEYNSCYYKDECGDNCTPKKQSKVEYCCYENADKILTMINEVLK